MLFPLSFPNLCLCLSHFSSLTLPPGPLLRTNKNQTSSWLWEHETCQNYMLYLISVIMSSRGHLFNLTCFVLSTKLLSGLSHAPFFPDFQRPGHLKYLLLLSSTQHQSPTLWHQHSYTVYLLFLTSSSWSYSPQRGDSWLPLSYNLSVAIWSKYS